MNVAMAIDVGTNPVSRCAGQGTLGMIADHADESDSVHGYSGTASFGSGLRALVEAQSQPGAPGGDGQSSPSTETSLISGKETLKPDATAGGTAALAALKSGPHQDKAMNAPGKISPAQALAAGEQNSSGERKAAPFNTEKSSIDLGKAALRKGKVASTAVGGPVTIAAGPTFPGTAESQGVAQPASAVNAALGNSPTLSLKSGATDVISTLSVDGSSTGQMRDGVSLVAGMEGAARPVARDAGEQNLGQNSGASLSVAADPLNPATVGGKKIETVLNGTEDQGVSPQLDQLSGESHNRLSEPGSPSAQDSEGNNAPLAHALIRPTSHREIVPGFNPIRDPLLSHPGFDEVEPTPGVGDRFAGVGAVSTSLPQATAASGSHADAEATGSVPAERATLAGQPASQDNAGGDASIAVTMPTASMAVEGNVTSDAKGNLARASHSTKVPEDRAADRVPERSVHFAGAAEFANSSSIHQAERTGQMDPMLLHDVAASAQANESTPSRGVHAGTASGAGSFVGDTFAALDAETVPPVTTWIQAGTRRAEAGYQDPTLGWVGVRAQSGSGGLHAAIVPGSTEAAQALDGHLAGLNEFMAGHHGHGTTVTLASPESGLAGGDAESGRGVPNGSQQQQEAQGRNHGASRDAESQMAFTSQRRAAAFSTVADSAPSFDGFASMAGPRAAHISVVA